MAKIILTLEDRPDGSVATVMDIEGEAAESGGLSPALIYGITFRALQESEIIDEHAVVVMTAVNNGERPSQALLNHEERKRD